MVEWKAKIEQQLTEISDSVSVVQASNQCATFTPSASGEWDNWFATNELGDIPVDFPNWLENGDLVDMAPEKIVPDLKEASSHGKKPFNFLVKIEPETIGEAPSPGRKLMSNILVNIIEPEGTRQHLRQTPSVDAPFSNELNQAPSPREKPCDNPSVNSDCTQELELLKDQLAEIKR